MSAAKADPEYLPGLTPSYLRGPTAPLRITSWLGYSYLPGRLAQRGCSRKK